jgi:hypothetical protein
VHCLIKKCKDEKLGDGKCTVFNGSVIFLALSAVHQTEYQTGNSFRKLAQDFCQLFWADLNFFCVLEGVTGGLLQSATVHFM